MRIIEINFKIGYNHKWAKTNPKTKGSLWLWSLEKKYTDEGIEIHISGAVSEVRRNFWLLKILAKTEFRPSRLAMLKKAISMIEQGKTGKVIF